MSVGFALLDSALPHVKAGKLKVLTITNSRRSEIFPDCPTLGEANPGDALQSPF